MYALHFVRGLSERPSRSSAIRNAPRPSRRHRHGKRQSRSRRRPNRPRQCNKNVCKRRSNEERTTIPNRRRTKYRRHLRQRGSWNGLRHAKSNRPRSIYDARHRSPLGFWIGLYMGYRRPYHHELPRHRRQLTPHGHTLQSKDLSGKARRWRAQERHCRTKD